MFFNKLVLNPPVNDCLELEERNVHLGTGHCSAEIQVLKFPLLSLSAFRNADLFTNV